MPRHRDEWEDDYRAGRGDDRRSYGRRGDHDAGLDDAGFRRGADYGRERADYERGFDRGGGGAPEYGRGPERGRPPRYEYEDRDVPRGGRPLGLRNDYDAYVYGRGDFYLDDEYYAGWRGSDEPDEGRRPRGGGRRGPADAPRGGEGRDDYAPRRGGAARSHLRCRDIMTRDVTVAARDTTLDEVARMMRDEDTGIIPVVEQGGRDESAEETVTGQQRVPPNQSASGGRLLGLITDRDIVVRALAEGRDPREVRAEEVMTTGLHTALPNDRVIEVIRLMGDKQVRRVPVVDREGNLRGIISMADVALETEADRELADALEEISSGHSFWNRIFG
ncbi:MAG TPA: CBS domain-containing protein [Pyrinomonadaceae bacterium]|nr:CBS domain-containing protein [Pyrinomonadaceae bacterium]